MAAQIAGGKAKEARHGIASNARRKRCAVPSPDAARHLRRAKTTSLRSAPRSSSLPLALLMRDRGSRGAACVLACWLLAALGGAHADSSVTVAFGSTITPGMLEARCGFYTLRYIARCSMPAISYVTPHTVSRAQAF